MEDNLLKNLFWIAFFSQTLASYPQDKPYKVCYNLNSYTQLLSAFSHCSNSPKPIKVVCPQAKA